MVRTTVLLRSDQTTKASVEPASKFGLEPLMDRTREPLMVKPTMMKPPTKLATELATEPLLDNSIGHRWLRWDASCTVDLRSAVLRGVIAVVQKQAMSLSLLHVSKLAPLTLRVGKCEALEQKRTHFLSGVARAFIHGEGGSTAMQWIMAVL